MVVSLFLTHILLEVASPITCPPSPFHYDWSSRRKGLHWWRRSKAHKLYMELHQLISIGQFKHTSKVKTERLVGVSTSRSLFKKGIESLSFSTHKQDINEWVAPKLNNTSKGIPLMKHLPWIRSLDFEASAPLRVKTLIVAFGPPVWSFRLPPFYSFLGCGKSLRIWPFYLQLK